MLRWRGITISFQPFCFSRLRRSQESIWKPHLPTEHPLPWETSWCAIWATASFLSSALCSPWSHSSRGYFKARYIYKYCMLAMSKQTFLVSPEFWNSPSASLVLLAARCLWQGRNGYIPKVTGLCRRWEEAEADKPQPERSVILKGSLANSLDALSLLRFTVSVTK